MKLELAKAEQMMWDEVRGGATSKVLSAIEVSSIRDEYSKNENTRNVYEARK